MFKLDTIIRENIRRLKPYSSASDEFTGKGIMLDANENPYGDFNRYPDPYQKELKTAVVNLKQVNANNIFVANGSDELIDLLFLIFCKPGIDKAMTFSPTYGMYDVSADINDVELIKVMLDNNFDICLDKVKPVLEDDKLKLIFICYPNNPTGNCFDREKIEYILNNTKAVVVIDEAYIDFSNESSFVEVINKYPNLVVSQTMSKAWGLASARIGFGFADDNIIQLLNKVKAPYNVSGLSQLKALETISDIGKFNENIDLILEEKSRLKDVLSVLDIVKKVYPSEANFWLVKFYNADNVYKELLEYNIVVRDRSSIITDSLRISIGTTEENSILIEELKKLNR